MKPYPSIETIFVRDADTKRLRFGEIRIPEVACITEWIITEKIDGTNTRAIVTLDGIEVKGRSDNAQLQKGVEEAVLSALPPHNELIEFFTSYRGKELPEQWSVTFYGECYGASIQKGGGKYSPDIQYRVFDILLGEFWWCNPAEMDRICDSLSILLAPQIAVIDTGTISQLVTRDALAGVIEKSRVAEVDPDLIPEGIVARPPFVLLDKHGERVMWKLTFREFRS